jgi:hypothetical protein
MKANEQEKELLHDIISVETENRGTYLIGSILYANIILTYVKRIILSLKITL